MRNITPSREINSLDLEPIISSLHRKYGWDLVDIYDLSDQYRKFLYISLKYSDSLLIPYPELHEFWCEHIVHTKKYILDCQSVFGTYLQHDPTILLREDLAHYWEQTLAVLEQEFPTGSVSNGARIVNATIRRSGNDR